MVLSSAEGEEFSFPSTAGDAPQVAPRAPLAKMLIADGLLDLPPQPKAQERALSKK